MKPEKKRVGAHKAANRQQRPTRERGYKRGGNEKSDTMLPKLSKKKTRDTTKISRALTQKLEKRRPVGMY